MPDADDFDVEYFRALLQGNKPKDASAPPAGKSPPAAGKTARRTSKPASAKEQGKPETARRKGRAR